MARRLVTILLCCATLAAQGMEPTPRGQKPKGPTTWPVGTEFVHLGYDRTQPPKMFQKTGDFAWVEAPRCVVQAAKGILAGNPKTWEVNKIRNYGNDTGREVVALNDRQDRYLICLVEKDRWIRLNEEAAFPLISELSMNELKPRQNLSKIQLFVSYLESVTFLYRGSERAPLSKATLVAVDWNASHVDKKKGQRKWRSLCFDPILAEHGADLRIVMNVATTRGAVERWTIRGERTHGIAIRNITIKEIVPAGSFSCFGPG